MKLRAIIFLLSYLLLLLQPVMPMLDYQLNRGCLSDLFDIKDTSGLLCNCPEKDTAETERPADDFILISDSQVYGHSDAAGNASTDDSSLLDLETYAVFLPLVQPVLMQRFPRKLNPESEPLVLYPQTRPGSIIIPPKTIIG